MKKKSVALTLLATGALAFSLSSNSASERYFDIARNLDIFASLFKEVNTYYVDEVPPARLVKTGIDAMLKSLDPYTNYIPEDDIEDFRTMTTGQYGGIGAIVITRNGKTLISMPHEGFPAQKAGLLIGDEVTKIDGITLDSRNSGEISKLLKGQAGTVVKLEVRRFGVDKPFEVPITRANIQIDNVPYYGMVSGDVGYLQLQGFTVDAGKEVRDAVTALKGQGAKKLIIDLRDNPGGLLNEAITISNLFVDKGKEIVSTKGKVTEWNKVYKALDAPLDTQMPIAVIASGRSASAAEIVSGVLQDYDRAVLIGERTFGKGLVQATRPLPYNSQLKVTTAKYYIPSGRCIQELDYSHRKADGSVSKFADSTRTAFKTAVGRTVYDGGGISPDVAVVDPEIADITRTLVNKGYIFDFATRYRSEHPTIASAKEFHLAPGDYDRFVSYLGTKDVSYKTGVETAVEDLVKQAKEDKHYEDIKTDVVAMQKKIQLNKSNDLVRFKAEIVPLIEAEIVSRYYFQKGLTEASFGYDEDVKAAVAVLNDAPRYAALLKPTAVVGAPAAKK
jgi:carboxyl-terminal processing protease